MHALHEPAQHLWYRVLSVACSGFLTVAPRGTGVCSAWEASGLGTGKSACATSHDLFITAFSTASGSLSITVK